MGKSAARLQQRREVERKMSELQQEFVRVCGEGASPRVVEEGWAAVRGLLEQRDKLANLASCAQAQTAGGRHTLGSAQLFSPRRSAPRLPPPRCGAPRPAAERPPYTGAASSRRPRRLALSLRLSHT